MTKATKKRSSAKKAPQKTKRQTKQERATVEITIPEPGTLVPVVHGPDGKPMRWDFGTFVYLLGRECEYFNRSFARGEALKQLAGSLALEPGMKVRAPRDEMTIITAHALDPGAKGYPTQTIPTKRTEKDKDGKEKTVESQVTQSLAFEERQRLIQALVDATSSKKAA